jgi:hypothetical protein
VFSIPDETPEIESSKVFKTPSRSLELSGSARSRRSLRDINPAIDDPNPLRYAKGEVPGLLGSEPRETAALLEERIVSPVYIPESLLEHLRIGLLEPERLRSAFEHRQLGRQLLCGDAFAELGIVALAPVERPVVDEPSRSGHAIQGILLGHRRAHPELVDLSQQHVRGSILEVIRNDKTVSLARLRGDSSTPLKREAFSPQEE